MLEDGGTENQEKKILSLKEELKGRSGTFWAGVGTYYARKACSGEVVGDWMQHGST